MSQPSSPPYCSTCNDEGCCDECETHEWYTDQYENYFCVNCGKC